MAVAEALARGLPVVSTRRAPFPTPCRARRACWWRRVRSAHCRRRCGACWTIGGLRARLAGGAREARRGLPTWARQCGAFRRRPRHCCARVAAMTGFSADWLALREPFDRSARQAAAAAFDLPALAGRLRGDKPALEVVDLACGTGANLRELGPRLRGAAALAAGRSRPATAGRSAGSARGLGGGAGSRDARRRGWLAHRRIGLAGRGAAAAARSLAPTGAAAMEGGRAGHGRGAARPRLGRMAGRAADARRRGEGGAAVRPHGRRTRRLGRRRWWAMRWRRAGSRPTSDATRVSALRWAAPPRAWRPHAGRRAATT